MKKNFKYLFEDRKIFGFYTDELFIAFIVGLLLSAPVYLAAYYSGIRIFNRFGGLILVVLTFLVASAVLSTLRLVRGSDDKTFYVKLLGRNENPRTFRGKFARLALYLMTLEKLGGREKIVRTRNYSP